MDLGYQTFDTTPRNLSNLWLDTGNGDIYTSDVNRPEDKILLKYTGNSEFSDYEDYNPIPVQERNIKPLAIEYLLEGDTVPDWAVGGYLLIGADQTNGNSIIGIVYDENGNYVPVEENDWVIISYPFCGNGDIPPHFDQLQDDCLKKNVPLLLDCAWFGTCRDINIDVNHPAITEVCFSLTKGIGLGNIRYRSNGWPSIKEKVT